MAGTQGFKGVHISQADTRLVIRWWRLRRHVNSFGDALKEGIYFLVGLAFFAFPASAWIPRLIRGDWGGFQGSDFYLVPLFVMGALVVYRGLTLLINRDLILVTPESITVRGRPLPPWDMEKPTIPRNEIARVESKVRSLSAGKSRRRAGVTHLYDVVAVLQDGTSRNLISGSTDPEPAHYVANQIAKFLTTPH